LLDAASFISTRQKRQGLRLSCPEEIAYGQKWITTEQLQKLAAPLAKNGFGGICWGWSSRAVRLFERGVAIHAFGLRGPREWCAAQAT
jgi:hypothetical protein